MSQDSTKTTDLMLKAMANFDKGSYSSQMYKEFPKLIIKGGRSFLEYLDTYTFQTVQMKNMKRLFLSSLNEKTLRAANSSCILDKQFLSREHISINDTAKDEDNELSKKKKNIYDDLSKL